MNEVEITERVVLSGGKKAVDGDHYNETSCAPRFHLRGDENSDNKNAYIVLIQGISYQLSKLN